MLGARVARLFLSIVLPIAFARREIWNLSSRNRYGPNSSTNGHVTFGRVSLAKRYTSASKTESSTGKSRLDTSRWSSSRSITPDSINYSIDASAKLRKRNTSTSEQDEKKEDSNDVSPAILDGVSQPLIDKNIWERLTGREFQVPSTVKAFSKACLYMTTRHSNNDWVKWRPADKITTQTEKGELNEDEALSRQEVLIYLGTFSKEGYGSQLPLTKTRSLVPISPKAMTELLMDSSRVKSYNKMSLGRDDILVMQKGLDTQDGSFGDGETKIVRNLTKPPLTKNKMEFVTMMHARALTKEDDVGTDGYLVVSRAVGGDSWGNDGDDKNLNTNHDDELVRNEILLGANLIQPSPTGNPNESLVTSVTHVYSPAVPAMLAGKVGSKGAVDFVKDIRNLSE